MTEIDINISVNIPCEKIFSKLNPFASYDEINEEVVKYLRTQGYNNATLSQETIMKLDCQFTDYWAQKIK